MNSAATLATVPQPAGVAPAAGDGARRMLQPANRWLPQQRPLCRKSPRHCHSRLASGAGRRASPAAIGKGSRPKLADEGARALAAQQSVRITSEKLDQLLNLTNQAQQLGVRTARVLPAAKLAAEMLGQLSSVRGTLPVLPTARCAVSRPRGAAGQHDGRLEMDQYSELQELRNILREGVEDLADLVGIRLAPERRWRRCSSSRPM